MKMQENLQNLETMEKLIELKPAKDNRHAGGGIGGARMHFVLKGPLGAVVFTIRTGWYLKETTEWKEICIEKTAGDFSAWMGGPHSVSYCSPTPLNDEQKNLPRENCDWLGGTCYGDIAYTLSDEPWDLLIRVGLESMWGWLEGYYHQILNRTT